MPYGGNPDASPGDRVRFLVGDTDPVRPGLSDAEVAHLLAQAGGAPVWAAPLAADALAAKFAHQVTYGAGRVSRQLSGRADAMRKLAAQLRLAAARYVVPVSTGQNRDVDVTDGSNAALKQPHFVLEQFDDPQSPWPGPREEPA